MTRPEPRGRPRRGVRVQKRAAIMLAAREVFGREAVEVSTIRPTSGRIRRFGPGGGLVRLARRLARALVPRSIRPVVDDELQEPLSEREAFFFDLLPHDEEILLDEPLETRSARLARLVPEEWRVPRIAAFGVDEAFPFEALDVAQFLPRGTRLCRARHQRRGGGVPMAFRAVNVND